MRELPFARAAKLRTVFLLLVGLSVFVGFGDSMWSAWKVNLAYIDLSRAIAGSEESASRFKQWASGPLASKRERDASLIGTAMLVAKRGEELPPGWLEEWTGDDEGVMPGTQREQMMLEALVGSITLDEQVTLVQRMDASAAGRWLVSAALNRPLESRRFVDIVEARSLTAMLSAADRRRLATVYGRLALEKLQRRAPLEEARALADKSLGLDPKNEMGMVNMAVVLYYQQQLQAGLWMLQEVTRLYPISVYAWEHMAYLQLAAKDYGAVEKASRKAISLSSGESSGTWAESLLATALLKQGLCAEALPYAEPPVRTNPSAPNYLLTLADVYWCLGDREKAYPLYSRLQAVAPDYASHVRERAGSVR